MRDKKANKAKSLKEFEFCLSIGLQADSAEQAYDKLCRALAAGDSACGLEYTTHTYRQTTDENGDAVAGPWRDTEELFPLD